MLLVDRWNERVGREGDSVVQAQACAIFPNRVSRPRGGCALFGGGFRERARLSPAK